MKNTVRMITTLTLTGALVASLPSSAQALTIPHFPSCSTPQGTLIANYSSGVHGIPGQTAEHRGSDQVYKINNDQVLQCFCPEGGGTGIQTEWLKVGGLSEDDREVLRRSGWIFIPNGSLWGLDGDPYMARNSSLSCNGVGGGSVLGASTGFGKVLGLADTGTIRQNLLLAGGIALNVVLFWAVYRRLIRA